MTVKATRFKLTAALLVTAALAATPAHAFRCGNKLVREGMHEQQVRKACGEPASARVLGTSVRGVYVPVRRGLTPGVSVQSFPGYGPFAHEVVITEYVYNFGPRKFMRRLLFEGGVLESIEKIGYGYHAD